MELSLLLTARCNASCGHCSTNCGPYRTESLSRETLFSLMNQAAALSRHERPEFYLTGGEPFLDFELLLELIAHGRTLGAIVTCVTNGFWATSDEKARATVAAVKAAGLAELAVSSSRFHEPFVSRDRVRRVLAAAQASDLRCTVKYVHARSDQPVRAAHVAWARAAGASAVQELPLLPHLRDGEVLPEDEYEHLPGLPQGECPSRLLSIREDGSAYTCCTPGAFNKLLRLGSVHEQPLRDLRDRFYLGGIQQILREHGPAHFARAIQQRGLGHRLRDTYANVCHLCTHIAADPALAAVATTVAAELEIAQLERALQPLIVPAAA